MVGRYLHRFGQRLFFYTDEWKWTRDLLFTLTMISFLSAFPSLSMSRNIRNSALLSASPCERRESPPSPTRRQANSSSVRSSSPSRSANIDQTFYQYCKLKEACGLSNEDVWLTEKQQSSLLVHAILGKQYFGTAIWCQCWTERGSSTYAWSFLPFFSPL